MSAQQWGKKNKEEKYPYSFSGQNLISNYMTKSKKETHTHNEHQQLPQKTEYSPGSSAETNKTRGKPETTHSPTNATKQHNKYSDQGYSIPETSL